MKTKIFTMFALFASLALAACNPANQDSKADQKSETPSAETSSKHTHKYGEWEVVTAATCEAPGSEKRVCECGEEQTREIKATGHTWDAGVVTKEATCSVPGEKTFTCTKCNATKKEEILADHDFSVSVAHDKGEGEVTETIDKCSRDDTIQIKWDAQDAAKEASSGFTSAGKFTSKGDYAKYTFYSPYALKARLYCRIANRSASSDNPYDRASQGGHQSIWFDYYNGPDWKYGVKVNDVDVDQNAQDAVNVDGEQIAMKELMYQDFLAEGADELVAPWFEFDVVEGQNTIRIERTQGYSVSVKDFRVIGNKVA